MVLEIGMDGGVLLLITRTPSFTEILTGSHFVLKQGQAVQKIEIIITNLCLM